MKLSYLVAHPAKPLDVSTIHDGPLCPGSPYIVNGIRTKIGEHLLRPGGLSSPSRPRCCYRSPTYGPCQLDHGHDGCHAFDGHAKPLPA